MASEVCGRKKQERSRRRLLGPVIVLGCLALAGVAVAHEPDQLAKQRMLDGGYWDFAWIGAEHMLTGYDHLLFLLGVLFFLTRPLDVVKFITAFTLGHTVTLLFGTLAGIKVDPFLIDAVIALTVVYKAFENLDGFRAWFKTSPPPLLLMIFAFGLIHGMGLSTRLQEMTIVSEPGLVGRILMFNVGVEFGQIAALLVMGAVIAVWRHTPAWRRVSVATNAALIAAGLILFAVQIDGFLSQPPPAERASLEIGA